MNDKIRILVVEDEPIVAADIKTRLSLLGYQIVGSAATGEKALELAGQLRPDLALLDIRIKGAMDGIEVALEFRRRWRLPLIFLTAYSEDSTLERAKLAEPQGYILKPFEDKDLKTAIEIALYRHKASEEIQRAYRLYAVLSQVNQAIVRLHSREALFQEICRIGVEFGQFQSAWLVLVEEPAGSLAVAAQCGARPDPLTAINASACEVANQALREGKTSIRKAPPGNEVAARCRECCGDKTPGECGAFPIQFQRKIHGALCVRTEEKEFFKDAESKLLEEVALDISFALDQMETEAQRRQLEAACRASERRYRQLVDFSPDPILVHRDNRILFVNTAAVQMAGASSAEELIGRSILDFSPLSSPQPLGQLLPLAPNADLRSSLTTSLLRLDGAIRDVEVASSRLVFEGQPASLLVIRDITERKRSDREREQLQAQLIQAQKMEAVGQLAGGVAHDFHNILTAILLQLNLLQSDEQLDRGTIADLNELEIEAQRAATLTRQLLMFSRREVLRPQVIDLHSLLANLLKMLHRLIGEHFHLDLRRSPGDIWIEADPGMVEQVIMNLVVNARDAMPGGGPISLLTRLVEIEENGSSTHAEARPGRYACVTVADAGCGMDAATIKHIFEPFFTTKEAGKGTGLGLATVYGIAKQHQGWVEVRSELGKGSSFSVFLPACHRSRGPAALAKSAEPTPGGDETILVVEDDKSIRALMVKMLGKMGYRLLVAENAGEAFRVEEAHQGEVDLLITDMIMPGGTSGLELVEQMLQKKPKLRAILVSGYSHEMEQSKGRESGRIKFIAKPFTGPSLGKAVRESLDAG